MNDDTFIAQALEYSGEPVPAYEMLSRKEQRFFDAIANDEDLIAVLRGHLYVEADVDRLLASLFPGSLALIDDLTYEQKIRRLRKSMDIPRSVATLLKALGELRNAFAHSLERELTEADDSRFFAALDADFKPAVNQLISDGAFPARAGSRVRAAIIVLHTALAALSLRLRQELGSG